MKRGSTALAASVLALSIGAQAALSQTVLAPRGTDINATLTTTLNTKADHSGDTFTLTPVDTWFHKNPLPAGSVVDGHLEHVSPASPTHSATMVVVIDDVKLPDGSVAPFNAKVVSLKEFEPKKHLLRDSFLVVTGAVGGHILSKRTGKAGGTLAGAAAGFALASSLKSDINVKRGTLVKLKAQSDVVAAR